MQHGPNPCYRVGGIEQRYSNKNYSDLFRCGKCGKAQRFSLNFLGGRRIPQCDGEHIKAGPRLDFQVYTAMRCIADVTRTVYEDLRCA